MADQISTLDANRALIQITDLTKVYQMGEVEVHALRGVSLEIQQGEMVAIMGPSGSGKSTLMNIIGCLDQPTAGTYVLDSQPVDRLKDNQLADIRNQRIGFVFQTFNLLSRTTALDNVALPLIYGGKRRRQRLKRAREALESVGLGARLRHTPAELSGGQQQRVAIARALINQPTIILADEPTGNLDSQSGQEVMDMLRTLNRERGITVIVVTHDPVIAQQTARILQLHDGRIVEGSSVTLPATISASEDRGLLR
jgi:putative ABC transport system ATP-binding protein